MRIFAASLATESNSFSPIPTSRASYEQTMYFPPGEHPDRGTLCTGPLWVARRRAKQEGFELIEGSCFWAEPSGADACRPLTRACATKSSISFAPRCRSTACCSACTARWSRYGYDDCEGDLIARVREIVGPKAVIGVELDPHCHLTEKRVRGADVVDPVQGIPAHGFRRARRGTGHAGGQGDPRRHQAGRCRSTTAA